MTKIVQTELESYYYHYPAGATIVTTHSNGRDNAMAVAWHTAISRDTPIYLVSISPKRFTHKLLVESGEFTVNFMSMDSGPLVGQIAGCSGADIDKFAELGIKSQPGSQVKAAVLDGAQAAYECKVVGQHTYGDHDAFLGEIVAVQWEPSAFSSDASLDLDAVKPILYLGEDYYTSTTGTVEHKRDLPARAV
jgi:flavin reductase (DIM6/NTAB) family NADH-FMN oxidoreductase RutF